MDLTTRHFASKLLLFGEYSIIHGSSALAIPVKSFSGKWVSGSYDWSRFIDFLKNLEITADGVSLDTNALDEAENFVFESNIPTGYGLGSSAALTAAFFENFFIISQKLKLSTLRNLLADIESFFHGTSSGIDPLVSYLNQPIHILEDGNIEIVDWRPEVGNLQFYLYNSDVSRNTKTLVNTHKQRFKSDPKYQTQISNLIRYNNAAIRALLGQNNEELLRLFYRISAQERDSFEEMIPAGIRADYDKLSLKLCGAGGGGFFLGLAEKEEASMLSKRYPITLI